MPQLTGGQALAQQLVREGITHVFGVPGVQLDWAVDALVDVSDHVDFIVPRHEQATAYMADGYARTTGNIGACMVVPGPGLLNAMAGLATAYACGSPVLALVGEIPLPMLGRGHGMLHEIHAPQNVLAAATAWQALARSPAEIPGLLNQAVRHLRGASPRPVALRLPQDVLQAKAEVQLCQPATPGARPRPDGQAIVRAAARLAGARRPAIWAGGGVAVSGASDALRRLAERLDAPVVMSENGRGALSDQHPLALTSLGGRALLPHADVVLVVGSRFLDGRGQPLHDYAGKHLIYLNADESHMGAPRPTGVNLVGDAREGLAALIDELGAGRADHDAARSVDRVRRWCAEQLADIEPQLSFVRALREAIPHDGILVSEMTQVGYFAGIAYPVYSPRSFITAGYQGTLGFGFPTALGAAIGNPGRKVVSITGDGGFGWNLQELATAARDRIALVTVVFVDHAFGNVQRIQQRVFGRSFGVSLHNPDFLALAQAFGVRAGSAESPAGLADALRRALDREGPELIVVPVSPMPGPWHLIHGFTPRPKPPPPDPLADAG
jgi:acetolactate synthase-1/2/3 large subunit